MPRKDGKAKGEPVERGRHPHVADTMAATPGSLTPRHGRPAYVINEKTLYELAKTHASFEHMGLILGISPQTLSTRPDFRAIIDRARAECCKDLLAAQFKAAITDRNPTMQIWLGKQFLEQKDIQRVERTGADGGPQQHEHQFKAVAYFPPNGRNANGIAANATARQLTPGKGTPDQEEDAEYEVVDDFFDEDEVTLAPGDWGDKPNPAAEAVAAIPRTKKQPAPRRQARAS